MEWGDWRSGCSGVGVERFSCTELCCIGITGIRYREERVGVKEEEEELVEEGEE